MLQSSLIPQLLRRALVAAVLFACATMADAQNVRPGGGSTRSNAIRPTGTTGTNRASTGTGTSSSNTGPRQYRSNTMLGDATIQIDPETRSLVVVTDEETHTELMKVIKTLDQPKPQVLIKVVFIEVTYNKGSDVGVEGNYTFNLENPMKATTGTSTTTTSETGTTSSGRTTTTNTSLVTDIGTPASLGETVKLESNYGLAALTEGTFARVLTDNWQATLRLLATRGKLEVLSRPSIMARNNQEAVIVVGQEIPFITNSQITDNGQTINTIQYDNIGIILRVTPFITSDGTVEMIVAPEISTLTDRTIPISNTASAPVIAKRSAETVVVTPNGQTVVIGGLMETQRIESVRKVPILGDIPILGFPFKRTIKDDVKRELLIFLTPFIVNGKESSKDLTTAELDKNELVHRAFNQEELDNFLDLPQLDPQQEPQVQTEPKEIRRASIVVPAVSHSPKPVVKSNTTKTTTISRPPTRAK